MTYFDDCYTTLCETGDGESVSGVRRLWAEAGHTHLRLVSGLRMRGSITLLSHMPARSNKGYISYTFLLETMQLYTSFSLSVFFDTKNKCLEFFWKGW